VLRQYFFNTDNVARVEIREKITEQETTLSGIAHAAGVTIYPYFQNAGYRGMYNMDLSVLKRRKGIDPSRSLLDFMRKDELAATFFRLSLTEGRIKRDGAHGQHELERVAEQVGRTVRKTMIDQTAVHPENIPIAEDIQIVRRGLKRAHKEMKRIDGPSRKKLPPAEN
jgi:DNA-damage-inducible protein D